MRRYYSGIGSRETPLEICGQMTGLATEIEKRGFTLRSGGARGADTAFAAGAVFKRIYRPEDARGDTDAADLVMKYHPNPGALTDYAFLLMARNCYIILGKNLKTPSEFVACYTKGGGGTAFGITLARAHEIPVYNLFEVDGIDRLRREILT